MSKGRNRDFLPDHYFVHGHCGQHLQPDSRTRRLYPFDCFIERLVGLSVTQPITEKRRWCLSFASSNARVTVEHDGNTETDAHFQDGYCDSPKALARTLNGD